MKFIFEGKAQSKATAIGLLSEDLLLDVTKANEVLSSHNIQIDRIETIDGQKVVYISEKKSNLLCE